MWFVFPQLRGLGSSDMAKRYGIASREEASAYLAHPLLGSRLRECTAIVHGLERRTVEQIFGYPDDLKFHSSMTLFAAVAEPGSVFEEALGKYFNGAAGERTLRLLG